MKKMFILFIFIFLVGCTADLDVENNDTIENNETVQSNETFLNNTDLIDEEFEFYVEKDDEEVLYYELTMVKPSPCHTIELVESVDQQKLTINANLENLESDVVCSQVLVQEKFENYNYEDNITEVELIIDSESVYTEVFR